MKCPKKLICPKRPANSLPFSKKDKFCTQCEEGKDMTETKRKILEEVKKYKKTLVLDLHEVVRLDGFAEDKDDYYYMFTSLNKGEYLSSCVGGFYPLKGVLNKEEYERLESIFKLNILRVGDKIYKRVSLEDLLDKEQQEKLAKWMKKKKKKNEGAIGGRYTYEFTPTGLGYIIKVKDNIDKNEIDLTDSDNW